MFQCKACGSSEFNLMVNPAFQGQVEVDVNDLDELVIRVNGQEFVADLMFMNQFAVCTQCDAIHQWEYHFPNKPVPEPSAPEPT